MKLNVIMTVYNRARYLHAALQALRSQLDQQAEVIIADDGSNPDEWSAAEQAVAACGMPARLLRRQRDGFRLAAARNAAIRSSTGDYLLFIDCDILLLGGAVDVHMRQAEPGRFLVGNRALLSQADTEGLLSAPLSPAQLEQAWHQADGADMATAERQFRRNVWLRRFGLAKRHKPKLLGCHFSLYRRDLEQVNGFDEHFVGWGLEDDDLALRLYASGMRSASVIPVARALHLWHPSGQPSTTGGFASPNRPYFERRQVEAYCREGLLKDEPERVAGSRGRSPSP